MRKKCGGIIMIVLIVWAIFPDYAFADADTHAEERAKFLGALLDILSWVWVVPATVAGKLLTNDFVYGEAIGLTTILWKIRQNMRIFAYFTLGFVFISLMIKHIIVLDDGEKMFDTLKKTFLAGILIQMSWFFMAVLVDLSIIMTAAVGAIPLQVMDQQWDQLQYEFKVPVMQIDSQDGKFKLVDTTAETTQFTLEDITPDADTVAGPLIFLAGGVMRLMDARFIDGEDASKNYSALVIGAGLKIMITLLFIVPMVLLAIINAIRIFWIWIWVIASPFLVLDMVFNGPLQNGEHADKFKPSAILGLIFQPVAVVGLLSLGLIMIIGIFDSLLGGEEHKRESLHVLQVYIFEESTTQIGTGVNGETFIVGELFKDLGGGIGGFIGEMILAFFAIFLLFAMLKAGSSFSNLTKGIADKGFTFMKDSLKAIPLPGIGSIGAASKAVSSVKQSLDRSQNKKYRSQADSALAGVNTLLGLDSDDIRGGLTNDEVEKMEKEATLDTPDHESATKSFFTAFHKYTNKEKGITYTGEAKKLMGSWFTHHGKEYLKSLLPEGATVDSIEVQRFIDAMMTTGTTGMNRDSKTTKSAFSSSTKWKGGKRTG